MHLTRRIVTLGVLACVCIGPLHAGQEAAAPARPALTDQQMEAFLLKARVTRRRDAGGGVTNSQRATLTDGTLTHDAHIQTVAVEMSVFQAGKVTELNFKDLARYNVTAYRLSRLVGFDYVPVSVERTIDGKGASFTWWVDDVLMDERERLKQQAVGPDRARTYEQLQTMHVWDELIQNRDRNRGNILWTKDWTMWLIDHTRAFRWNTELMEPEKMVRSERGLLERMRALTPETLTQALGQVMTRQEMTALLARRDEIVRRLDERIAMFGEEVVLYSRR